MKSIVFITALTIAVMASACTKDQNKESKTGNDQKNQSINLTDKNDKITFSGITWRASTEDSDINPEDFSVYSPANVSVDGLGRLHLKIEKIGDMWFGAELTADSIMGYGEYEFYLDSKTDNIDRNVCLNLIVQNADSPEIIRGVSQLGVQFSYWGEIDSKNALQYFMYATDKKISEVHYPEIPFAQSEDKSIHKISLNPEEIYFASTNLNGSKIFDQLRISKKEKGSKNKDVDEIIYSKPGPRNKMSISLGLPEANEPGNSQPIEIIISKVIFKPYNQPLAKNK